MKPAYKVLNVDLSVVFSATPVTDPGQVVESITVQALPAGASVTIAIGQNSDDIPLTFGGQNFAICPGCDEKIILKNPTAAAGTLTLIIGFGGLTTQLGV